MPSPYKKMDGAWRALKRCDKEELFRQQNKEEKEEEEEEEEEKNFVSFWLMWADCASYINGPFHMTILFQLPSTPPHHARGHNKRRTSG
jgi:hypothetical protein